MLVLGFNDYETQGRALAQALGVPYAEINTRRFPDGESYVRLPDTLDDALVVCRSLNQPNDKLIELMLVSAAARSGGVKKLTLVAPYLCYMRQDKAFHRGEPVSQRVVGQFVARYFDALVTVDPHLHRIATLAEAVPCAQAQSISATEAIVRFLHTQLGKPLLVGPDSESEQWVQCIAAELGSDYCVAEKKRLGDRDVSIDLPKLTLGPRDVVIVDDIISTGRTIANAAQQLRDAGAQNIHCFVTHALFSENAQSLLRAAGIKNIWSTDSVAHQSNTLPLAHTLADAVRRIG